MLFGAFLFPFSDLLLVTAEIAETAEAMVIIARDNISVLFACSAVRLHRYYRKYKIANLVEVGD